MRLLQLPLHINETTWYPWYIDIIDTLDILSTLNILYTLTTLERKKKEIWIAQIMWKCYICMNNNPLQPFADRSAINWVVVLATQYDLFNQIVFLHHLSNTVGVHTTDIELWGYAMNAEIVQCAIMKVLTIHVLSTNHIPLKFIFIFLSSSLCKELCEIHSLAINSIWGTLFCAAPPLPALWGLNRGLEYFLQL